MLWCDFRPLRPAVVPHFPTQNIYERATRAELTKDLDTAFRLYLDAGTAFINLSHAPGIHPHAYEEARQCAARAVERAERIKAVKADLTPVWRDPFALGSSFFFSTLESLMA
jgi:calpain-7